MCRVQFAGDAFATVFFRVSHRHVHDLHEGFKLPQQIVDAATHRAVTQQDGSQATVRLADIVKFRGAATDARRLAAIECAPTRTRCHASRRSRTALCCTIEPSVAKASLHAAVA